MKKVTAFVGTARRQHTHDAVQRFLENVKSHGGVEYGIVALTSHRLEMCRGCESCFRRGEEFCPLKDDRDALIGMMAASDGVVFATPDDSYQVSATMKASLDRLGFVFHRPRFFGKTFTSTVAQGISGGAKMVMYLDSVGMGLGFDVVEGSCTTALDPMNEKERRTIDRIVAAHGRRSHAGLSRPRYPVPALIRLCGFRAARTSMRVMLDESARDFTYYRDKGWFEADYFHPTRAGVLEKATGSLVDATTSRMTSKREQ